MNTAKLIKYGIEFVAAYTVVSFIDKKLHISVNNEKSYDNGKTRRNATKFSDGLYNYSYRILDTENEKTYWGFSDKSVKQAREEAESKMNGTSIVQELQGKENK